MIPEVSTAIRMSAKRAVDAVPREQACFADSAFIDRIGQQRPRDRSQPAMGGNIEAALRDDRRQDRLSHQPIPSRGRQGAEP